MGLKTLNGIVRSDTESKRFGLEIHRGVIQGDGIAELWKAIVAGRVDVAIVRVPAGTDMGMSTYAGPRGQLIHADTLVYYKTLLGHELAPHCAQSPAVVQKAKGSDREELAALVLDVFEGYPNHYYSNPLFEARAIAEGYAEWATGFLVPKDNQRTWTASIDGRIVGFICCKFDPNSLIAEIVLNGVARPYAGRGIYGNLLNEVKLYYSQAGCLELRVSTQIGNRSVQRAWSRAGFTFYEAWDTWHVNSLLGLPACDGRLSDMSERGLSGSARRFACDAALDVSSLEAFGSDTGGRGSISIVKLHRLDVPDAAILVASNWLGDKLDGVVYCRASGAGLR